MVAEKFEAMVKLGKFNSRLKDFFDLWLLSRQFEFDGRLLSEAIARTFEDCKTVMSAVPIALTAAVANDPIKQTQWKGFVRKSRLAIAPAGNAGFAARIFIAFVVGTLRGWSSPAFGAAARERWSQRSSGVRHGSVRRQLRDYVVGPRENRFSGATFDADSDGVCQWSR